MQIMIDIPDRIYNGIIEDWYSGILDKELYTSIKNGTPLPPNCGRLISANKIEILDPTGEYTSSHFDELIEKAPTIIEADKEKLDADRD